MLFLGKEDGIRDDEGHIISQMTCDEVVKMYVAGKFEGRLLQKVTYALQMIEQGVPRVHILGSKMAHALLVEYFQYYRRGYSDYAMTKNIIIHMN